MKRKPVPPAPVPESGADVADSAAAGDAARARIGDIRDAVPLVPKPEDDCCRRLIEGADVPDRGTASAWLVFLAALGVVAESDAGYARTQDDIEMDALSSRFRENVFLAADVVDALGTERAQSPAAVFEVVREAIPRWERTKRQDWEAFWTERVERRLDWAVAFGLAERTADGYRRAA